jgi:hypothetical protein
MASGASSGEVFRLVSGIERASYWPACQPTARST